MEKKLILRGLISGALAGLLAYVFGRIFAEPLIQKAVNYESARDAAQAALDKAAGLPIDQAAGPDIFSRTVQADIGMDVGMIAFGAAMGLVFAVVYTLCLGRVGAVRPRPLALLVGAGGFLAVYFVPFLKYPANPPSIGHPETIRERGLLYLLMVFTAVALLAGAVWLGQRLRPRFGTWTATLLSGGAYVAAVVGVMLLLPSLGQLGFNRAHYGAGGSSETPTPLLDAAGHVVFPGFPADTLYGFRIYSVGAQLILWGALALIFAPLAERLLVAQYGQVTEPEPLTV